MNLYIFEDVLWDYTSGMAVIAAESYEQAIVIAINKFGENDEELRSLNKNDFLKAKVKIFKVDDVKEEGVISFVYGGC